MITNSTPKVYLSRRNLLALLSKLDREAAGESTHCMVIKNQNPSPTYQQTMKQIAVIAVEDDEYYGTLGRAAGEMHPSDEQHLPKPATGVQYAGPIFG